MLDVEVVLPTECNTHITVDGVHLVDGAVVECALICPRLDDAPAPGAVVDSESPCQAMSCLRHHRPR